MSLSMTNFGMVIPPSLDVSFSTHDTPSRVIPGKRRKAQAISRGARRSNCAPVWARSVESVRCLRNRGRPKYLREQVWACTFFEEFAAKNLLDAIGTNCVLFETDYPHPICLYGRQVLEKIDAAFGDLSPEVRNRVLFANAAELYGVGVPDRRWNPIAEQRQAP